MAGESPFVKSTGKSLVQCQAIDPGGDGAVALGSGGGFDMDSSQLGQSGVPLQAVVSVLFFIRTDSRLGIMLSLFSFLLMESLASCMLS